MANLSGLKSEIRAARDIGKITNAMQLVATAKLRRVGKKIAETQMYVSEVYTAFNEIIQQTTDSVFLKKPDQVIQKTLWVVINSSLGLCGGYNANVNKMVLANLKSDDEIYAIGTKAISFYSNRKKKIWAQKANLDLNLLSEQSHEIGQEILEAYNNGTFDEIKIAYTKFINNANYTPAALTIFPIVKNENVKSKTNLEITFEPSAEVILETMVSLYLNTVLFGTMIESQVSEQASRRTAMENATNNGQELVHNLSIKFNRERQAAITQEINEIVSGANAQNH